MQSVGSGAGEFGRVQQPTMEGFDKLSAHKPSWIFEPEESGPIKTVYSLTQRLTSCVIKEKLILYHPLKRIDCEVSILDWDGSPYREFRLALPVAARDGNVAYEVPMGVVEVGKSEVSGDRRAGLRKSCLRRADVGDPAARGPEFSECERRRGSA